MIKIKMKNLLDSTNILKELSTKELNGRAAYKLGKIIRRVDDEFALFNEAREKLIKQYAAVDENGEYKLNSRNEYTFEGDNMQKFVKEINELTGMMVEIDASQIKLDDIAELKFTPAQMVQLEAFIEE